jgi:hypothetical protein
MIINNVNAILPYSADYWRVLFTAVLRKGRSTQHRSELPRRTRYNGALVPDPLKPRLQESARPQSSAASEHPSSNHDRVCTCASPSGSQRSSRPCLPKPR